MKISKEDLALTANTIRMLSVDGVERANSGHPGMPMGMAECGVVLWLNYLRFHPGQSHWIARDRFVLSNGHGSMFLYSLLHLSGYDVSLEDLKKFRQLGSNTPGHPESFMTDGVECTTGPLGQGIANAVGMAIGQKVSSQRFDQENRGILDHKVYSFCGDGCLMEGISSEACSLAGHLGLGNLNLVYDDNQISIAGNTDLAFTEDVLKRFESYGWHVLEADGHDFDSLDGALAEATAETARPSIIAAKTHIGFGSPNKVDTAGVHGSPLGKDERELAKKNLNWPLEPEFFVPERVLEIFTARKEELAGEFEEWKQNFEKWKEEDSERSKEFQIFFERKIPENLQERLLSAAASDGKSVATRKLSSMVLQEASAAVPSLLGGSADLEPSTLTVIKDSTALVRDSFAGKNIHFGVREHGMGAILNGLAYYGGFIPYGSTFLVFSDYMRPSIRIAALSHLPVLFIFTHDSVFLGEDGPTHQPIEHLASLRAMPNLNVFRPADGVETAMCYQLALENRDGPSLFALTRQGLPPIERSAGFDPNVIRQGAYTVHESRPGVSPELVFVGTGSEVSLALSVAKGFEAEQSVRVLSMPCVELFLKLSDSRREELLPASSKKVVVEAGSSFGWRETLSGTTKDTLVVGIDSFGASAPMKNLEEYFGFTENSITEKVQKFLRS